MKTKLKNVFLVCLVGLFVGACGNNEPDDTDTDNGQALDEWGRPIFDQTATNEIAPGKDDAVAGQRGLPVSVDSSSTAVWEVRNAWADTDTAEARKAGIAWGENSGLNWDEKYQAWVASMDQIESQSGYSSRGTFQLTTPWGTELPSPTLECAEVAIFLRITFASWYNLPFFMEARDRDGRIYFGHFGARRDNGKYSSLPDFKTKYRDYSDQADAVRDGAEWPSDSALTGRKIPGSFDDQQPQLGAEGLHAGDYFDRIFLNKRVGHFLIYALAWFGSVNLADSSNTFNLAPQAVDAGDVLLERWQAQGIGHTLVVMRSEEVGTTELDGEIVPQLEVELASGSMPRRQPVWESPASSKRTFLLSNTGGPEYGELGGGIKRWRTAKNISGRWTNVVMADYAGVWINSRDIEAIEARPEIFRQILTELTPDQKRDVLLEIIESKRQHLRNFPASCSARINRESTFDSLYELMGEEFGMSPAEVDAEYRTFEDYVFAELEYQQSKTCCWNRSTAQMYEIIMDYAVGEQEAAQQCMTPTPFMNRDDAGDGFDIYRQHAESLGRGGEWVAWSADETCPWQDIPEATLAEAEYTPYCDLPGGGTVDPVDPPVGGSSVELDFASGDIPDNNTTGLQVTVESTAGGELLSAALDVDITHTWNGDLEIELVHPDGTRVTLKEADSSDEDDVVQRFAVEGFAGKAAAGTFTLVVRDTASQDTGTLNSATLTLTVAE